MTRLDYYSGEKYKLDDLACFLCLTQSPEAASGANYPDAVLPKPAAPVTIKDDLAEMSLPGDGVGFHRRRLCYKQRHCRPASSAMRVLVLASIMPELFVFSDIKDACSILALCSLCHIRWRVAPNKQLKQQIADSVAFADPVASAGSAACADSVACNSDTISFVSDTISVVSDTNSVESSMSAASDTISVVSAQSVVKCKQRIANSFCDVWKKHGLKLRGVGVSRIAMSSAEIWALRWLDRIPDPSISSVSDEDLIHLALLRMAVKFEFAPEHAPVALHMLSGGSAEAKERLCELECRLLMALPPAASCG